MSTISLLDANISAAVLETLLYGAYAILAFYTLYLTVARNRERRRLSNCEHEIPRNARSRSSLLSPVGIGALALWITHWLLNVSRLYIAFKDYQVECLGPQKFYSDHSQITEVLKCAFMVASVFIGDSLIIHHLWVVWAFRTRIVIVPSMTLAGSVTFGIGLTYQLSTYGSDDNIFKGAFRIWCTGICFSCLCTSMYTTGGSNFHTRLETKPDIAVSVIWGLFHTVAFESGSNLQLLAIDCIPVMIGISNLFIQIRLHWDLTSNSQHRMKPKSRMTSRDPFPNL
ncbi:hypothetical protein C8R45DRAFT_941870 [Mycena sanguinolenta]|nr:hypothetical protein C8R45DRAFT_941870 [Mycena sanguinolenta]